MTAPRVSVLIPTWNRVQVVPGAVASVLDQTFADFEIVVVVDGSTDGTADVLRRTFDDPRLRILEKANGGLASARNAGVAAARGDLIALLDDDDRCLPERIACQVRALDANPGAALCLSDARYDGAGAEGDAGTLYGQPGYRSPDSLEAVFEGAWTLPSVMMFRAPVLRALGFDESIFFQEDTDFLFRFHRAGHGVVALPDVLVLYATGSPTARAASPSSGRTWTSRTPGSTRGTGTTSPRSARAGCARPRASAADSRGTTSIAATGVGHGRRVSPAGVPDRGGSVRSCAGCAASCRGARRRPERVPASSASPPLVEDPGPPAPGGRSDPRAPGSPRARPVRSP